MRGDGNVTILADMLFDFLSSLADHRHTDLVTRHHMFVLYGRREVVTLAL